MAKIFIRVPLLAKKTVYFNCSFDHCSRPERHLPHSVVDSFKAKINKYFNGSLKPSTEYGETVRVHTPPFCFGCRDFENSSTAKRNATLLRTHTFACMPHYGTMN